MSCSVHLYWLVLQLHKSKHIFVCVYPEKESMKIVGVIC